MTRKKLTQVLNTIFGWGVLIVIIAGALSFFGFLIALVIGPPNGEALAVFLQKQYFPLIIRATSIVIGIGLAAMYAGKQQALSLVSDKQEAQAELAQIKADQPVK